MNITCLIFLYINCVFINYAYSLKGIYNFEYKYFSYIYYNYL